MNDISITLYYQYLMHDIDQWTFRLAKMRVDDDERRADAQSSQSSSDKSFYRRKIVEAIAYIRGMLKNRLAVKPTTGTDLLDSTVSGWVITLKEASYDCDAQTMADLMHKYVVRSVIADWSVTYAPDSATAMAQEKQMMQQELFSEVYNRKKPEKEDHAGLTDNLVVLS